MSNQGNVENLINYFESLMGHSHKQFEKNYASQPQKNDTQIQKNYVSQPQENVHQTQKNVVEYPDLSADNPYTAQCSAINLEEEKREKAENERFFGFEHINQAILDNMSENEDIKNLEELQNGEIIQKFREANIIKKEDMFVPAHLIDFYRNNPLNREMLLNQLKNQSNQSEINQELDESHGNMPKLLAKMMLKTALINFKN